MDQIDWISDCYEEKRINWDEYYEAMAEKEDIRYQDRIFEEMKEDNGGKN